MNKYIVTTFAEWIALPELPVPTSAESQGNGIVYNVLKVGFFAAEESDCDNANLSVDKNDVTGKCHLPTMVVKDATGKHTFYRLPLSLLEWAESVVGLVMVTKTNPFPTDVEFCLKDDRIYAEML